MVRSASPGGHGPTARSTRRVLALTLGLGVLPANVVLAEPPRGAEVGATSSGAVRGQPAGGSPATPAAAKPAPRIEGAGIEADLALVGVIIREDGESLAVVEDRKAKRQTFYKVGASLAGATVKTILPDRVVLAFADGEVQLRLVGTPGEPVQLGPRPNPVTPAPVDVTQAAAVSTVAPGFARVERSLVEHLSRSQELYTHVTMLPNGGAQLGEVRQGGLLHALGLRKDDVIRSVNGRFIGQNLTLASVVEQAIQSQVIRIEYVRAGQPAVRYVAVQP